MGNRFYKHPAYGFVYCGSEPTPQGRLVWPWLTKAKPGMELSEADKKAGKQQNPDKYQVEILLPKNDEKVVKWIESLKAITDEGLKIFNKGRSAEMGACKLFGKYGDGDEADHEKYPFYKGVWKLLATNQQAPKVVDSKRNIIDPKLITGGVIGRLVVCPLITASGGITYKLEAVQLIADDGVKFGGAARDAVELLDACEDSAAQEVETLVAAVPVESEATPPQAVAAASGVQAAVNLL